MECSAVKVLAVVVVELQLLSILVVVRRWLSCNCCPFGGGGARVYGLGGYGFLSVCYGVF